MPVDRPANVLLVEDSPADAHLISTFLERGSGGSLRWEHCNRLSDALEFLDGNRVEIILLDFSLPDSQGIGTYRTLRDARPEVPVIVLTSLEDDEIAAQAVGEGAQDFLVKRHVDARLLNRAIRYAMERHQSEEALRLSEERYALAVRGANDGLWDWDLETGEVYLSPRWKAMLGYRDDEVGSRLEDWHALVHEEDRETLKSAFEAHLQSGTAQFELEHRMVHRSGELRWVLTRGAGVRSSEGRVLRMAGSQTDVTARKLAEQQLLHDAFHDELTGLANRALFVDRTSMALASLRRGRGRPFGVLFLDLDRFKHINDSLGHSVGDGLLMGIARRFGELLRPGDTVARLGGDEFALLATNVRDVGAAVHFTQRIQESLAEPFLIDGHEVFVTASIGIAFSSGGAATADGMLRDADIAMYRAKAAGRARYEIFDHEMHRSAVQLLKMETELRRAVENGDFVMHFQPIVVLDTGNIVGFEALVRWRHAERGLLPPSLFIGIAEETGLIVPLGWFVLEQACRLARKWQTMFPTNPPLFMSVNASGRLFAQNGAVEEVTRILTETQLSPSSLRLEVTESVLMDHGDEAVARLMKLRSLGVQLSLDDFGTGYSSLSYLQRFRYDSLKIDRSFVDAIAEPDDSSTIVETILSMASNLGIGVVAEGVETAEQLEHLRSMNCPLGQGYWFARPMPVPEVESLMSSGAGCPGQVPPLKM